MGTAEKLSLIDMSQVILVKLISKNGVRTSAIKEIRVGKIVHCSFVITGFERPSMHWLVKLSLFLTNSAQRHEDV
jgi:hypothetical protein